MNSNGVALRTAAVALLCFDVDRAVAAAPEQRNSELRFHTYDEQDRMRAESTVGWLVWPFGGKAAVELTAIHEAISGASPEYVTNATGQPVQVLSSASIVESRDSAKLKYSHYVGDNSISVAAVSSSEDDYESAGVSAGYQTENKSSGLSLSAGVGYNDDDITSSRDATLHESRKTTEYIVGATQVLNKFTVVQTNLSVIDGEGYFSDPYKFTVSVNGGVTSIYRDVRPSEHKQYIWLTSLRHYVAGLSGAGLASYRYYQDDWGVIAHTVEVAWDQTVKKFSVRPSLRYYTQRQADFYAHELPASPRDEDGAISTDHRLAGFGAVHTALKLAYAWTPAVAISGNVEYYFQDADLKLGPGGSSFDELKATIFSLGISAKF